MGKTYKTIPFFSDEITIRPHSATESRFLGGAVKLRHFADSQPIRLLECTETGELRAERVGYLTGTNTGHSSASLPPFIEGPEVA